MNNADLIKELDLILSQFPHRFQLNILIFKSFVKPVFSLFVAFFMVAIATTNLISLINHVRESWSFVVHIVRL